MTGHQRRTDSLFAINLPIGTIPFVLAAIFAAAMVSVPPAEAQTITVLHSFTGGADGSAPYAGVTLDRAGNLYGTTTAGANGNVGTVYKLSHMGSG